MIARDQPTCFPDDVIVRVSSRSDGTMLDRTRGDRHEASVVEDRRKFASAAGITYDDCAYQIITYDSGRTYDVIQEVVRPDLIGYAADVLYTEQRGLGLFLPIADCVGTVIYDTKRRALALAHLGRHASVAQTMTKTIDYFLEKGSNPEDLVIWMAPSVGPLSYRMDYFDAKDRDEWRGFVKERDDGIYLDLRGYNRQLAVEKGVQSDNIVISPVDTATDAEYFSHSQGDAFGRFAVVCSTR